jgi:hypothetical protein
VLLGTSCAEGPLLAGWRSRRSSQLPTFAVGGLPVLELVLQLSAGASSDDP